MGIGILLRNLLPVGLTIRNDPKNMDQGSGHPLRRHCWKVLEYPGVGLFPITSLLQRSIFPGQRASGVFWGSLSCRGVLQNMFHLGQSSLEGRNRPVLHQVNAPPCPLGARCTERYQQGTLHQLYTPNSVFENRSLPCRRVCGSVTRQRICGDLV